MDTYEKLYYDYLTNLIDINDKIRHYNSLLTFLFYYDFTWLKNIPLDENRAVDGLQLRSEYKKHLPIEEHGYFDQALANRRCSMLEMFVAFADRLTYIVSDFTRAEYFWLFIDNLGLDIATNTQFDEKYVEELVNCFIYGKKFHQEDENPPVLFPCREVYENLNKDLYMQANYYLKYLC